MRLVQFNPICYFSSPRSWNVLRDVPLLCARLTSARRDPALCRRSLPIRHCSSSLILVSFRTREAEWDASYWCSIIRFLPSLSSYSKTIMFKKLKPLFISREQSIRLPLIYYLCHHITPHNTAVLAIFLEQSTYLLLRWFPLPCSVQWTSRLQIEQVWFRSQSRQEFVSQKNCESSNIGLKFSFNKVTF